MMDKAAVCIATNRPDDFRKWREAWHKEFTNHNVTVFLMHDSQDDRELDKLVGFLSDMPGQWYAFNHNHVALELQNDRWIIPMGTSACKSYPIYKAWKLGHDPIMVLDDDCYPIEKGIQIDGQGLEPARHQTWIKGHVNNMLNPVHNHVFLTCRFPFPRGYPHLPDNPVMLSHGLWTENADTYAHLTRSPGTPHEIRCMEIPTGCLFPMSGMNLAFRHEIAPLMYFGLQGKAWSVDRFDDIWCGFLAKKVLDHCGYAAVTGEPCIRHIKASDPFANIVKEAPGYKLNVELYEWVKEGFNFPNGDLVLCMKEVAGQLASWGRNDGREYWKQYGEAIQTWLKLFEPEPAFGI
jgi:hypothetical protein